MEFNARSWSLTLLRLSLAGILGAQAALLATHLLMGEAITPPTHVPVLAHLLIAVSELTGAALLLSRRTLALGGRLLIAVFIGSAALLGVLGERIPAPFFVYVCAALVVITHEAE